MTHLQYIQSPAQIDVWKPTLPQIDADLARRGLSPNTRQLYCFLWRAKTQPKRLPLGLIFAERTLAKELHMSVRTVRRALQRLATLRLLRVMPRRRADGGTTSNRYDVTWQPMQVPPAMPKVTQAPLEEPALCSTEESATPTPSLTPDTVLAWPAVTAPLETDCPGEGGPECHTASAVEPSQAAAILDKTTFSKSDQPSPGAPIWKFTSQHELEWFLRQQLKTHGISPARTHQWIRRFGLARVAQVAVWVSTAPVGTVRWPGGWVQRALDEAWEAPRWVAAARATRQQAVRERAEHERARRADAAVRGRRDEEDAAWQALEARVNQLPELQEHAAGLARGALGRLAAGMFRPGRMAWRVYLLKAAKERPDLVVSESAG